MRKRILIREKYVNRINGHALVDNFRTNREMLGTVFDTK